MKRFYQWYARLIVENRKKVLGIGAAVIVFALIGITDLQTSSISYDDMTPDTTRTSQAQDFLEKEFSTGGSQITVLLEINGENSTIEDIRNPRALQAAQRIEQNLKTHPKIRSVDSINSYLGDPDTLSKTKQQITQLETQAFRLNSTNQQLREIASGLEKTSEGLNRSSRGVTRLSENLGELESSLEELNANLEKASSRIEPREPDLSRLKEAVDALEQQNQQTRGLFLQNYEKHLSNDTGSENLSQLYRYVQKERPNPENWNSFQAYNRSLYSAVRTVETNARTVQGLKTGVNELESNLETQSDSVEELGESLEGLESGYSRVELGVEEASASTGELASSQENLSKASRRSLEGVKGVIRYRETFYRQPSREFEASLVEERYFDEDYSKTLIRVSLVEIQGEEMGEVARDVENRVESSDIPRGLSVGMTGQPFIFTDIEEEIRPTVERTGSLSFVLIGSFIFLFFMTFRHGLSAFLTVVTAEILTLGFMAWNNIPVGTEMSAMVSIILAFGDGFGIQLTNRFRQEMREFDAEEALEEALSKVMKPMLITTTGIVVGFQAFRLGELNFLATLANVLTVGVLACFTTGTTLIPALLITLEKRLD